MFSFSSKFKQVLNIVSQTPLFQRGQKRLKKLKLIILFGFVQFSKLYGLLDHKFFNLQNFKQIFDKKVQVLPVESWRIISIFPYSFRNWRLFWLIAASAIWGAIIVLQIFFNRRTYLCFILPWLLENDFFNDFSDFYCFAVKICVRFVISAFRSIAWLTSLTYGTLNFMKIY